MTEKEKEVADFLGANIKYNLMLGDNMNSSLPSNVEQPKPFLPSASANTLLCLGSMYENS